MTAGTVCVSVAADNELADVTLSGRLFQNCAAATGNARPPMVDSLNGGIRKLFDLAERSAGRPDTLTKTDPDGIKTRYEQVHTILLGKHNKLGGKSTAAE